MTYSEVEWGPGTADWEDTKTPSVLSHHPLEVLLTSLWCSAESSEQSVVPHLTCTTPPSCRVWTAGVCGQWPRPFWGEPNPIHKHVRTEIIVCAHTRDSGIRQHANRHVRLAAQTEGTAPNTILPSTYIAFYNRCTT